jgi:hypothetical protein
LQSSSSFKRLSCEVDMPLQSMLFILEMHLFSSTQWSTNMLTRIFNIYLIPTNICETTTQVMTELAEKWKNIGKFGWKQKPC